MKQTNAVGRFAPTPSGRMHLGNVFAALIAWLSVRSKDGRMVLRMEDLDTQRTSGEFAQILREDLAWLGLDYDRETPPQSLRTEAYDEAFRILEEKGIHATVLRLLMVAPLPVEDVCRLAQMSPAVVVAMIVQESRAADNYHESITTIGTGDAYIFQNGTAIKGSWAKGAKDQQIKFFDEDGIEVALAPGQTIVSAVPAYGSVEY